MGPNATLCPSALPRSLRHRYRLLDHQRMAPNLERFAGLRCGGHSLRIRRVMVLKGQNGCMTLGEPRIAAWPDDLGFVPWVRSRGWGNFGHVAMAAFLGFVLSLDAGVLFGSLWGFGLLAIATPIQYWRCRRANS